jgi:hypothetical protein
MVSKLEIQDVDILKQKAEPKPCLLEDFPNKITYSVSPLTMANYINFFSFLPSRDFGV